jgi:uncharacterized protein (TIGR02246 family)
MKEVFITGVLIVMAAGFSACAAPAEKTSSSPVPAASASTESAAKVEQEVRDLQAQYDKAALQQDAAAFDRLFADDFSIVQAGGRVNTKAEIIAMAKAGDTKMEVGRSEDVKVRFFGDTAIVTCRWIEKSTTKGKPFDGTQIFTTVWAKRNGIWQIVSDQGTLVAP